MRIDTHTNVESFTIFDPPKLDPITVVMQDMGAGHGRLIVECYGAAWSAWWGAMGSDHIRQFVMSCSVDYIVGRLAPDGRRMTKREEAYLSRIVAVVRDALHVSSQYCSKEKP